MADLPQSPEVYPLPGASIVVPAEEVERQHWAEPPDGRWGVAPGEMRACRWERWTATRTKNKVQASILVLRFYQAQATPVQYARNPNDFLRSVGICSHTEREKRIIAPEFLHHECIPG